MPAQALRSSRFLMRASLLALGLAVVAAGPAVAGPDTPNDGGVYCVLGSKAAPDDVITACDSLIGNSATSNSDRAKALVARAEARSHTSNGLTQEMADLDRAIALDDKNAAAYRLRGNLARQAGGDLARPEADLSKAIALDPNDAEAYELRGVVFTNEHRFDRAIADYDQAIKMKTDYGQAYSDRGATRYLAGDYDGAIRDLDEALRIDPNRARSLSNRSAAYKKLGQLDKSLADDDAAIKIDPNFADYYDNRGLTEAAMKDYDKAIADYSQALRMEQRANYFTNRGDSYQYKGELGTALDDYNSALKLDPKFALAYNNRAVLYKKMGERAKALADYETAIRLDPGNQNAIEGRRTVKAEIARLGDTVQKPLTATDPHPSFDCESAKLAVEKAICADPQLGALDRRIAETFAHQVANSGSRTAQTLRKTQRNFIADRNASFGQPGYDLRQAMERRLDTLQTAAR